MQTNQAVSGKTARVLPLASSLMTLAVVASVFRIFHVYDWGHPVAKCAGFVILFVCILFVRSRKRAVVPSTTYWWEICVLLVLLVAVLIVRMPYLASLVDPVKVDIGYTTRDAATLFFKHRTNPYAVPLSEVGGPDPVHRGFKYGPVMLLGYSPAAVFSDLGMKVSNLVYAIVCLALISFLILEKGTDIRMRISSVLFAALCFLIPERLWSELFLQGVIDIWPVLLMLLSLVFLKYQYRFSSGLMAGLSFSAKFFPAIVLILLFCRRKPEKRYFMGVLIGLLPLLPFLLSDRQAFLFNVFVFHATKSFDSTSLYSITPPAFFFLFALMKLAAFLSVFLVNFRQPLEYKSIIVQLVLVGLVIEATFTEVHANHLIFFIALIPIVLSWYRFDLFSSAMRATLKKTRRQGLNSVAQLP